MTAHLFRGLIDYIADRRFSMFEFWRHSGSAGSPNDVSTCFSVYSTGLGDTSLHLPLQFSSDTPAECLLLVPMPKHACHCIPLYVHHHLLENASLYFLLSVRLFLTCSHKTKNTITHTHTLRASVGRLYLRLFLRLYKECDPQWRDYRTCTKTLSQCFQSHALFPSLTLQAFSVWEPIRLYIRISVSLFTWL